VSRGYQYGYSDIEFEMHDVDSRQKKASTMVAVLNDYINGPLDGLSVLNVGGSTGIIDNYLSEYFLSVIGIDIDEKAINSARDNFSKDNLSFDIGDAMELPYEDETFDIVISSHIYEHVPDTGKMMTEIYRVLKDDGVCYFAGSNRIMWDEPHYHLPLLSVVPVFMSHIYLRAFRNVDYYYERHLTYWGLKKMVKDFKVIDYTEKIILNPTKYETEYMIKPGSLKAKLASWLTKYVMWLSPGYIWLLKKRDL